jgi:hypothetical protein
VRMRMGSSGVVWNETGLEQTSKSDAHIDTVGEAHLVSAVAIDTSAERSYRTEADSLIPYAFVKSTRFNCEIKRRINSIGIGEPAAMPVLLEHTHTIRSVACTSVSSENHSPQLACIHHFTTLLPPVYLGKNAQKMSGHAMKCRTALLRHSIDDRWGIKDRAGINDACTMRPGCEVSQDKACISKSCQALMAYVRGSCTHQSSGRGVGRCLIIY